LPGEGVAPPTTPPPVAEVPTAPNEPEVYQTLVPSQAIVTVGETFTVTGTLHYRVGMTKPVSTYRLYGFDKTILSSPSIFNPTFTAMKVGTTRISNDNAGTTGVTTITVVEAPAPPAKITVIGQTLTPDRTVVAVGDVVTVVATLHYSDGTSKTPPGYRLYGFDKQILSVPNSYTPRFVATAPGVTRILNDHSGVTGQTQVTVVAAGTTY
jgi:hypothetical protein